MNGFGCTPSLIPAPVVSTEVLIRNDGWFPDIDATALRSARRIRDVVTPERLALAVTGAIITVGNQLAAWQVAHLLAGHANLAEVPSPKLGETSRLVLLYTRAIGAYAKAELVETYRDTDLTAQGQRDADAVEPSIVDLRRDGIHAVRDMLGRARVRAELI
ncbi:head completion protein GPL [Sphingomonas sp. PP-F2F-A104-K0414]|uniref:head completion/stabilization protein n=1 Tax=Sphingomonas sp. PP-F2F-A104-K0414 TaxID=2135661 RepID=UPI001042C5B2|nr:head completion/stabilization protein [Sphingomonas sp. PP-F2F-A104-K0414]TCP95157.1 head completion protein GPL [Sphingomonas sp. PP-F2F-A104-K0414]